MSEIIGTNLLRAGGEVVQLPMRMLRACAAKAVAFCVETEKPGSLAHEHFESMMNELLVATSAAREALADKTGCANNEDDSPEERERKRYLRGLLKGNPVSLNGKLHFTNPDHVELDVLMQEALAEMEGVAISEQDEIVRYGFVIPADHPTHNLQAVITRRNIELEIGPTPLPEDTDPNGVYYSVAFGVAPR